MPPRKAQTGISETENEASFRSWRAIGAPSTAAIPASATIASSGSCRASIAASDSSRKETKTARGATSTAGARSHQLRSSPEPRAVSSVAAINVEVSPSRSVPGDEGQENEDEAERHESARRPGPGAQLRAPLRVTLVAHQQERRDQRDQREEQRREHGSRNRRALVRLAVLGLRGRACLHVGLRGGDC